MARRVDGSLGTLLQGISQQPRDQRLEGQVTDQLNMTSDVLRMLHRRAPLQEIMFKQDPGSGTYDFDPEAAFCHSYDDGAGNIFFIMVEQNYGNVVVYKEDGTKLPVLASGNFNGYVSSLALNPRRDLRAATIGAYTMFVNRRVSTAMTTDESAEWSNTNRSRVSIVAEQYSRDYSITVRRRYNNTVYEYTATDSTPGSTAGSAEANVAAGVTLDQLRTALHASGTPTPFTNHFNSVIEGNELVIIPDNVAEIDDYSIEVTDNTGGDAIVAITNQTVSSISKLPAREQAGAVYRIKGGDSSADDIYMRFDVNTVDEDAVYGTYFSSGIWVETKLHEGVLDATSMPHFLKIQQVDVGGVPTWAAFGGAPGDTFAQYPEIVFPSWADRLVGDAETNKTPEFIGSPIQDLAVFQDRLALIHEDGVHLSVSGDLFNLWKKTVTTLLDDGPIGLAPDGPLVNKLRTAQIHNRDLILFGENSQYVMNGNVAQTPKTATLSETTRFNMTSLLRPVSAGQTLLFPIKSGEFSGIREFYTESELNLNNARPLTVAAERLIQGEIRFMAASTSLGKFVCVADDLSTIYLYESLWEQGERIQSAWSVWNLQQGEKILHLAFFDDLLYVVHTSDSYDPSFDSYIGLAVLQVGQQGDISLIGGDVMLDRRQMFSGVTDSITVSDEYAALVENNLPNAAVLQGEGCTNPGMEVRITGVSGNVVNLARDVGGGEVYIGFKFTSRVTPTTPVVRDRNNNVIGTSKLRLGSVFINFEDAGEFNVNVGYGTYGGYTERNPGRVLGTPSATVGEFILTSGQLPVPIREDADRVSFSIETDSAYPMTITDVEWDGQFYKRGRRV